MTFYSCKTRARLYLLKNVRTEQTHTLANVWQMNFHGTWQPCWKVNDWDCQIECQWVRFMANAAEYSFSFIWYFWIKKKRFFSYTSINHFIYQSITSFSLQFIFMRIVLNPFLHISVHSVWLIFPLLRWNAKRDEWEILIAICFKFDYLKYLIFSSFRWFVDLNPTIFSIWKKEI